MIGNLSNLIEALLKAQVGSAASTLVKLEAGVSYIALVKNLKTVVVDIYTISMFTSAAIVGAFICLYFLMLLSECSKTVVNLVMAIVGGIVFSLSIGGLLILRSDRFWMKVTNINEMVSGVVKESTKPIPSSRK